MGQTKDYLTAVDLAGYTESVDRTIADDHSSFQLCNLLRDDLCQEIHDGIESLWESFCPNLGSRDRNHQSSTQSYRRRYTGGFTPQGPICFKCGVVGHKARNCTSQPHRYYTSEPRRKTPNHHDTRLVSNPVKHFSTSMKCIGSSPFVLKQEVSSLSREIKLKIPKTIEYNFEVRECSLLTEIVVAVDKDIDPNLAVETSFEVFTPPKSFDTPVITLTEKKILQAQEVSFIEISVDQYQVCELEENANYIVDDVQNVYAAPVFNAFTVIVFYFARDFEIFEKTLYSRTKENRLVIQIQKALWRKLEPLFSRNKKALRFKRGQRKCACIRGQILPTRNNNHSKSICVMTSQCETCG